MIESINCDMITVLLSSAFLLAISEIPLLTLSMFQHSTYSALLIFSSPIIKIHLVLDLCFQIDDFYTVYNSLQIMRLFYHGFPGFALQYFLQIVDREKRKEYSLHMFSRAFLRLPKIPHPGSLSAHLTLA